MKLFLKYILLLILCGFILLEVFIRTFSMYRLPPEKQDNSFYYKPNQAYDFTFGTFPFLERADVYYNDIGFNSRTNFADFDPGKVNIAIIGDSFVESLRNSVNENFVAQLDELNPNYQTYQFGMISINSKDYLRIMDDFEINDKFDYIFIITQLTDFMDMSSLENSPKRGITTFIIDYFGSSLAVRFLLQKLKMAVRLNRKPTPSRERVYESKAFVERINRQKIIIIPIFSGQADNLHEMGFARILTVDHEKVPYNYGVDQHWNSNGVHNVCKSIDRFITEMSVREGVKN